MKIPCAGQLSFLISGLSFLQPALSTAQLNNFILIGTALILGAKFNLSEINRMWLKEKSVSALSEFLSDAKFSTYEMQQLYFMRLFEIYKIKRGYFLIDDTIKHHSKFCQCIHGVSVIFDHAVGTNLKATCIVFLYWTDGNGQKFFLDFRIFYKKRKEDGKKESWYKKIINRNRKKYRHRNKYDLALEMIKEAIDNGFPGRFVLADAWYGIEPFVKGLKKLRISYVLELTTKNKVRVKFKKPKLTRTGKLAKKQYELKTLKDFFITINMREVLGFRADKETGKLENALYQTKTVNVRLNAMPGKHRVIESVDPALGTTKYLLTNELNWEAVKIISAYSNRWVIEEFFRNAKQLLDMEGATIRSEQGIATALYLVSWIDALLHYENYTQGTAGKLTKDSLTIPSIIRQLQYKNLVAVLERVENEEGFVQRWLEVAREGINRKRRKRYELVTLGNANENQEKPVVESQEPLEIAHQEKPVDESQEPLEIAHQEKPVVESQEIAPQEKPVVESQEIAPQEKPVTESQEPLEVAHQEKPVTESQEPLEVAHQEKPVDEHHEKLADARQKKLAA